MTGPAHGHEHPSVSGPQRSARRRPRRRRRDDHGQGAGRRGSARHHRCPARDCRGGRTAAQARRALHGLAPRGRRWRGAAAVGAGPERAGRRAARRVLLVHHRRRDRRVPPPLHPPVLRGPRTAARAPGRGRDHGRPGVGDRVGGDAPASPRLRRCVRRSPLAPPGHRHGAPGRAQGALARPHGLAVLRPTTPSRRAGLPISSASRRSSPSSARPARSRCCRSRCQRCWAAS